METLVITESDVPQEGQDDADLAAFLLRKKNAGASKPFALLVERRLQKLDESMHLEIASLLRVSASSIGDINFARANDNTKLIAVNAVLDARRVCTRAQCEVNSLASLVTQKAVNALIGHKEWSGQRTLMILVQIQRLMKVATASVPAHFTDAIKSLSDPPRRNVDNRVFKPSSYRDGAVAMSRLADLIEAGGRHRRRIFTLRRDAGLLAMASRGHLRLSEYLLLNTGAIRQRVDAAGKQVVTFAVKMSKTGGERFFIVRDPQIARLVLYLKNGSPDAATFQSGHGRRLSSRSLSRAFERAGTQVVGRAAGANILRKSRLLGPGSAAERSRDLGQTSAVTAERYYKTNQALAGAKALRNNNEAARIKIRDAKCRPLW